MHKVSRPRDPIYPIHFAKVETHGKWRLFARHGHKQSAKEHRMKDNLKICNSIISRSSIRSASEIALDSYFFSDI